MKNRACVCIVDFHSLLFIFRQNKSIDEDGESSGRGNGHGVRKIKITAMQMMDMKTRQQGLASKNESELFKADSTFLAIYPFPLFYLCIVYKESLNCII